MVSRLTFTTDNILFFSHVICSISFIVDLIQFLIDRFEKVAMAKTDTRVGTCHLYSDRIQLRRFNNSM